MTAMSSPALATPTPDFARLKALVLNTLDSPHSKAAYSHALQSFFTWCQRQTPLPPFSKALLSEYKNHLMATKIAAASINLQLSAIRKLAEEATDNGLLDSAVALGIQRVKGVKQAGTRTGNWLLPDQVKALLSAPDMATLKGVRDKALLAVLIGCGLRRGEASRLQFHCIQQREGRWAIIDIQGKGGRIRSIPMPLPTKIAIDDWAMTAGIFSGYVFRAVNNRKQLTGNRLIEQCVLETVTHYGKKIGVPKLAPHDLRRTFAKLAYKGKSPIDQIQFSLGHASIQTTEKYLGTQQEMVDTPCDHLGDIWS